MLGLRLTLPLRTAGRTKDRMEADFTLNFLGYYTDNGAYYYYNTEEGKTYGAPLSVCGGWRGVKR